MTRVTDASDVLAHTFDRRIIARKNLQTLDKGERKDAGKPFPPSADEEAEEPPLKPG